jgi:CheY-like chemotaxis protein
MPKTILVADDNPEIRKMLCHMFEVEEHYDICAEAANGQEAIDLGVKHRPDLIILDLSMPVMNGLEAAWKLKEIMPEVPIILFTQHAYFTHDLLLGADRPFDRIASKTDAGELMGHVKSLAPA